MKKDLVTSIDQRPHAAPACLNVRRTAGARRFARGPLSAALALALLLSAAPAAPAQSTYQKPPRAVLEVLDAPAPPTAYVGPRRDYMLLMTGLRYPPISELAEPMLRLAGQRINPLTSGRHRAPAFVRLSLRRLSDGAETVIQPPPGARLSAPEWSPDGRAFALTNTTPAGIELWVGETSSPRLRRLKGVAVGAVYGDAFRWMPDGRTLLVQTVPRRGPAPAEPGVPAGPNVQESSGKIAGAATYQDLLQTPHDEALFEYYATSQLALVDANSGKATPFGAPAVFETASPSPDGNYLLVVRLVRPYSYLHPASFFPKEVEVWTRDGKTAHKLASLPLADQIPIQGVRTGPRAYEWRPTDPATLVWAEALDQGDPRRKVAHRDRLMALRAPFTAAPAEWHRTEHRLTNVSFSERAPSVFVTDYDRDRRWTRTVLLNFDAPAAAPREVWSRSINDRYGNPGVPVTRPLPSGHLAVMQHGDSIYLAGAGASPEGDRPFLDRLSLQTLKAERLFHSAPDAYETVAALLDDGAGRIVTRRETPLSPPNYYKRTLSSAPAGQDASALTALTSFPDATPQLRAIRKQLVRYKRADGVECSFTLYLPPGYKEGTRLPTVLWAYPLEYNDPSTAGQVTGSTQRYTTLGGSSHLFLLLAGYAVLDDATMPVVGDPEKMNDTYVEQIVSSAQAAIEKAVEMGVADRERVGVGGHSYGAFMTANLLAHSDFFRAGIARSGAYNRTLTPFGFQSERRTLWEAPETYIRLSPFMVANKINEPILLIHGEADNNSGTFPIQSERLYQAIRGTGGTVRLVTLPLESHGYAARESTEHVLYEMISWFDRHVKNAPPRRNTGGPPQAALPE
ncbi:MAG TPA: prolyl oligopeptidase family serine peptidase [Pyrinomonadaceae bacterium]|nr:prolyl oligopeptidase family serine peptidase [Pyrinomonadaceae bacterium]